MRPIVTWHGLCVCVFLCWLWARPLQKRMNRSRCQLRYGYYGIGWGGGNRVRRWGREKRHCSGVELACAETCPRSIFSTLLDGDSSDATSGYQYCGNLLTVRVHWVWSAVVDRWPLAAWRRSDNLSDDESTCGRRPGLGVHVPRDSATGNRLQGTDGDLQGRRSARWHRPDGHRPGIQAQRCINLCQWNK